MKLAAQYNLLSGCVAYQRAGYTLWHAIRFVGENWDDAEEKMIKLQTVDFSAAVLEYEDSREVPPRENHTGD